MPPVIRNEDGTEIHRPIEDKPKYNDDGYPLRTSDGQGYQMEYVKDKDGSILTYPLYDFEVLPMTISRAESAWIFEMWLRLDPRITWADIAVRMLHGDGGRRPGRNTMNMACVRLRRVSGMKEWGRGKHAAPGSTGK